MFIFVILKHVSPVPDIYEAGISRLRKEIYVNKCVNGCTYLQSETLPRPRSTGPNTDAGQSICAPDPTLLKHYGNSTYLTTNPKQ